MQIRLKTLLILAYIIITILVVELVLLINQNRYLISIIHNDPHFAKVGIKTGQKIQNFQGVTLNGNGLKLSDIKEEKVLLIFFSTQCPACTLDIKLWKRINNINSKDIKIIGISISAQEETKQFILNNGLNFEVINDDKKLISKKLKIPSIPTKVLVGRDRIIQFFSIGSGDNKKNEILLNKISGDL